MQWGDYPQDSLEHAVYTFPLDSKYNDIKFVLNKQKRESQHPMIAILKDNILSLEKEFVKIRSWEEVLKQKENADFLLELTQEILIPITHMSFGEQGDDENRTWQETDYPMINYKKKEVRTVHFDK